MYGMLKCDWSEIGDDHLSTPISFDARDTVQIFDLHW